MHLTCNTNINNLHFYTNVLQRSKHKSILATWSRGPSVHGEGLFSHHQPLLLHPPVLKPDFNLLVAQVQPVGELLPFLSVDELVHQKLVLKFSQLRLRVGLSLLSGLHLWGAPRSTWRQRRQKSTANVMKLPQNNIGHLKK